jgi:hypothetical protein
MEAVMVLLLALMFLILFGILVALGRGASGVSHADEEPAMMRR